MKFKSIILDNINNTDWCNKSYKATPPATIPGMVSVILPTFNRCKFLQDRLIDFHYQIYRNFEVIIVDDGSQDDTENFIKNSGSNLNIRYIKLNKNSNNVSIPRNVGISYSCGEFICFADDDVVQLPNKISSLISGIGHKSVVVGRRTDQIFGNNKDIFHNTANYPHGIDTSQFLFRKSVYNTHPYVITTHADDFITLSQLFPNLDEVEFLDEVVCKYIWHDKNRTYDPNRKIYDINYEILIEYMNVINNILIVTEH